MTPPECYLVSRVAAQPAPGMFARVLRYDVRGKLAPDVYRPPRKVATGKYGRMPERPRVYSSEKLVSPW